MTDRYLYSGATGAANGTSWADAYVTLVAAFTGSVAGDRIFVAHNHAETQATAMTLTSPGTLASPVQIICANSAGTVPPVSADLATTATISTTAASAITFAGVAYCRGIIFSAGDAANSASITAGAGAVFWRHRLCAFKLNNTNAASVIRTTNSTTSHAEWDNCTVQFGATGQGMSPGGSWVWKNTPTAVAGATFPTNLFSANTGAICQVHGVDLSALAGTLVGASFNITTGNIIFENCKIHASATIGGTPAALGVKIRAVNCDSGGTNYKFFKADYTGTESTETTIIRTGGASNGTTGVAKKIITTANAEWVAPFECFPIRIWNDVVGSVTVTVYGISNGGAVPNNDDVWMDVEYLDDSGSPLGSVATTGKADILATNAANTTDTSTWGGSTSKFKMATTITPAQKGYMAITVKAAAASLTFYIDPKVELS